MTSPRNRSAGPRFGTWPLFDGVSERGSLELSTDERSVRESIYNILLTSPGERLMRPEFGAGLSTFVHRPNTTTTHKAIASAVERAIERFEPRVVLEEVDVSASPIDPTEVAVSVHYRARHDGQIGDVVVRLQVNG